MISLNIKQKFHGAVSQTTKRSARASRNCTRQLIFVTQTKDFNYNITLFVTLCILND